MTYALDMETVERIAAMPAVAKAAKAAGELTALWPLDGALRMDNDAKYTEDLQVRVTLAFARVLTGLEVTSADAEFVYEGADFIPGRPQEVVDALLAADEAYEIMEDYGHDGQVDLVVEAAQALGAAWDETAAWEVTQLVSGVAGQVRSIDELDMAKRFAMALTVCDALLGTVTRGAADAHDAAVRSLPVLLYVNELREGCSVPRICLDGERILGLVECRGNASDTLAATAEFIAPLAEAEWRKHREDVLWDPDEAKKRAKEEDERRNKEELAAKFADK
ncbi:hypothetical protein KIH75_05075 [Bifidobacterium sp. 64T4]|uniref:hypothetical protein n=1 Tax=Bifidobacterium pongonis TaxID=2834432 RepID=UPI001C57EA91|nr:hypothetical protein [Bifidobacterium pongonis]MBW3094717.1 hypothetical protein [Bifidobacterium pongonis]